VFIFVVFQESRYVWHQRVVWVRIVHKRTDTEKNLSNGKGWTPLFLEDIQTDPSSGVDVAVIYTS
jgi:hypothetical protein